MLALVMLYAGMGVGATRQPVLIGLGVIAFTIFMDEYWKGCQGHCDRRVDEAR